MLGLAEQSKRSRAAPSQRSFVLYFENDNIGNFTFDLLDGFRVVHRPGGCGGWWRRHDVSACGHVEEQNRA